ncbi:MAG: helix-turn-helix domain-containing protein [Ktedonobacterales bacterium]
MRAGSWRGRHRRATMQAQRAYKTELSLNDGQISACRRHAGAARWAYNWGLAVLASPCTQHSTTPTLQGQ